LPKTYVEKIAKKDLRPFDWCYVYNFQEPDTPKYLKLGRGMGIQLKKDVSEFIEEVKAGIQDVFESEDYNREKEAITKTLNTKKERINLTIRNKGEQGWVCPEY